MPLPLQVPAVSLPAWGARGDPLAGRPGHPVNCRFPRRFHGAISIGRATPLKSNSTLGNDGPLAKALTALREELDAPV